MILVIILYATLHKPMGLKCLIEEGCSTFGIRTNRASTNPRGKSSPCRTFLAKDVKEAPVVGHVH